MMTAEQNMQNATKVSNEQQMSRSAEPQEDTVEHELELDSVSEPYTIFTNNQKTFIAVLVSAAGSFSGFASNIYFPAIPNIAKDLSVSVELVNLTVTSYLIFQGLAPSLWGPLADRYGRRTSYTFTFLVFLAACIGLGTTPNYATLITLRALQSCGSASTIALGAGVIGDITTRAERGGYMGIFQAGILVPVAAGPIIGGALAGSLGWRSVFWFLAISSGVFLVLLMLVLPETLRAIVGNGSRNPKLALIRFPLSAYQKLNHVKVMVQVDTVTKPVDLLGPFRILFDKRVALVISFLSIYYMVWQMSITAMSTLFQDRYHISEIEIGLTFIANGVGSMVGTLVIGKILDIEYRRVKAKYEATYDAEGGRNKEENMPIERARLGTVWLWGSMQCASILVFGWTLDRKVYIAVPIICTFFTGWAAVSIQTTVMTYLVDVFPDRSSSASASMNLARCLMAAGGTSFVMPLIDKIGVGPCFSLLTGIMVLAFGLVAVQWISGSPLRK